MIRLSLIYQFKSLTVLYCQITGLTQPHLCAGLNQGLCTWIPGHGHRFHFQLTWSFYVQLTGDCSFCWCWWIIENNRLNFLLFFSFFFIKRMSFTCVNAINCFSCRSILLVCPQDPLLSLWDIKNPWQLC